VQALGLTKVATARAKLKTIGTADINSHKISA